MGSTRTSRRPSLYELALEMSELDRPDATRRAELLLGLGAPVRGQITSPPGRR